MNVARFIAALFIIVTVVGFGLSILVLLSFLIIPLLIVMLVISV